MESGAIVFFLLVVAALLLYLASRIAAKFEEIAELKGYEGRSYFWWTFWLPAVGIPMVLALPDIRVGKRLEMIEKALRDLPTQAVPQSRPTEPQAPTPTQTSGPQFVYTLVDQFPQRSPAPDASQAQTAADTARAGGGAAYRQPKGQRLANGNWKCVCGRVNQDYVYTCACGKNKRDVL